MILDFSCSNYKSFKDEQTISLIAENSIKEYWEDNIIDMGRYQILKSAVIYGANASGKSNFLSAMKKMRWIVLNSSKNLQLGEPLNVDYFRLSTETLQKPSKFEITILIDDNKYRYGFETDNFVIKSEWLLRSKKIKEYPMFIRENEDIQVFSPFPEGEKLEERTRNNALFLSVCAQLNGEISGKIINWFHNFNIISGIDDRIYQQFTESFFLKSNDSKEKIMELLRIADLGIIDIDIKKEIIQEASLPANISDEIKTLFLDKESSQVSTYHNLYDEKKNIVNTINLDFESQESEGSKKYFRLSGPIIDTLLNRKVLVIDELDARLHPKLTNAIVKLFNSGITNKNNAQFIFATHDTNLLSAKVFRRDQIWFAEKNHSEETDLYSLSEYIMPKGKKVRNDASFENEYIQGRYGAIPYIGDFQKMWGLNE